MIFKFLPYQFSQVLNDFNALKFSKSNDLVDMYKHLNPPSNILGYQIKEVYLYFVCNNLVASIVTLNYDNICFKPLLDKLNELIGATPIINNYQCKWTTEFEVLNYYYDIDDDVLKIYHTITEYDVMS